MNHEQRCDALEIEIDRYARALDNADFTTTVPSCPDWDVRKLSEHLGFVHQWANHLVRTQARERVPWSQIDFDRGPVSSEWMRRGGTSLLAALRSGDPDLPMWAWGADQHLRFWSRRQLHETLIHRVDLELASTAVSPIDATVAVDAIDEFLLNLELARKFSPELRELKGRGETLNFHTDDYEGQWTVRLDADGFGLVDVTEQPTASLSGSASDLLLVLYRRDPLDAGNVAVTGDRRLAEFWLAHSALV